MKPKRVTVDQICSGGFITALVISRRGNGYGCSRLCKKGVSALDAGGEFLERGRSKVNTCCSEKFLLWGKVEEEFYVTACHAVHCRAARNCPCRPRCLSAGNLYMRMRDEIGVMYEDEAFAPLFSPRG